MSVSHIIWPSNINLMIEEKQEYRQGKLQSVLKPLSVKEKALR